MRHFYCPNTGIPHTTAKLLWNDRWVMRVEGKLDNAEYLLNTQDQRDCIAAILEAEAVLNHMGLPLTLEVE